MVTVKSYLSKERQNIWWDGVGEHVAAFVNCPTGYVDCQRNIFPISLGPFILLSYCFDWIVLGRRGLSNPNQMVFFSFPSLWHSHRVAPCDSRGPTAGLAGRAWRHSDPSHHHMCHSCFRTAPDCHQQGGLEWEPELNLLENIGNSHSHRQWELVWTFELIWDHFTNKTKAQRLAWIYTAYQQDMKFKFLTSGPMPLALHFITFCLPSSFKEACTVPLRDPVCNRPKLYIVHVCTYIHTFPSRLYFSPSFDSTSETQDRHPHCRHPPQVPNLNLQPHSPPGFRARALGVILDKTFLLP